MDAQHHRQTPNILDSPHIQHNTPSDLLPKFVRTASEQFKSLNRVPPLKVNSRSTITHIRNDLLPGRADTTKTSKTVCSLARENSMIRLNASVYDVASSADVSKNSNRGGGGQSLRSLNISHSCSPSITTAALRRRINRPKVVCKEQEANDQYGHLLRELHTKSSLDLCCPCGPSNRFLSSAQSSSSSTSSSCRDLGSSRQPKFLTLDRSTRLFSARHAYSF